MAISKTAKGILRNTIHASGNPFAVGISGLNYGMGQTSAAGAAGSAIAGSLGHELMSAAAKRIFKRSPIGSALTFAGDIFLGGDFMQAGERIGNKLFPGTWGKNRLPSTIEQ